MIFAPDFSTMNAAQYSKLSTHRNPRWVALVLAWSAFGKEVTGLPIDFQIQQQSHANETEEGSRGALFALWLRDGAP